MARKKISDRVQRLQEIEAELGEMGREAGAILWRYGQHLGEVKREELWRDAGFKSFEAWVAKHANMGLSWVETAITVSQHFTSEMAERWGPAKLDASVGYVMETEKKELPGDIQALSFAVPGPKGRLTSVEFAEASYRDILAATKRLRKIKDAREAKKAAKGLDAAAPNVREKAVALSEALGPPEKGLVRGDRVAVQQKQGKTYVSFRAIDLDQLEEFLAAVRAHLLPKP